MRLFSSRPIPRPCALVPAQGAAGLVLDDPGLEEVALLLEVDHLAHPREGVGRPGIERVQADLLATAVGDESQVLLEHRGVQPQHAARHGVLGVAVLQLHGPAEQLVHLLPELPGPQVRVLSLIWLTRSMPKLQCIDSSRRMYMYCSAAPVILFWRPSARIWAKPT